MALIVELEHLTKRFGSSVALDGLSLRVQAGEMFGLIGPDGAGKTTAIRIMCGLVRPDGGRSRVLGLDPVRDHHALVRRIGYLAQRFMLYRDLTVDENLTFFAELHGARLDVASREQLLDLTQLRAFRRRLAGRLSGGMRQKLALACTLVHEPDLLFLDEPTAGVDPLSRRELWKMLSRFQARGTSIVLTTPYLDEAERCSRIALVHAGRELAIDDPSRLRTRFPDRVVEVIADQIRVAAACLRAQPDVVSVEPLGDRLRARVSPAVHDPTSVLQLPLAEAGVTVTSLRVVPASLEDVFIQHIERSSA